MSLTVVESNDPEFPEGKESWAEVFFSKVPENEVKDLDNGVRIELTLTGDSFEFKIRRWTQEEVEAFHARMRSPEAIAEARNLAELFGSDPDKQEAYHRSLFDRKDTCDKA